MSRFVSVPVGSSSQNSSACVVVVGSANSQVTHRENMPLAGDRA
jgi:hypothetical protein